MDLLKAILRQISFPVLLIMLCCSCSPQKEVDEVVIRPTRTLIILPTPTEVLPPQPTFDSEVQPYLDDVEEVLRHSAVVIKDRAVGIPNACPSLYLMAFPYSEPDRSGGMTLQVTALERNRDGSIAFGEHIKLWNLKAEGVEPERCKQIFIQNHSEPGLIRITFQVQDPYDRSWRIGVASGSCSENDLWLKGYFYLNNPDDFQLFITQYDADSPIDYWLRDGNALSLYHWEPWQENLLWTLENVPGEILEIDWSSETEDINADGIPDLHITWRKSGLTRTEIYRPVGTGFGPAEDSAK